MTGDLEEHPEGLIDGARRGGLDPGQQVMLTRHLAECPACEAEVSLAPRFERELAPQPRDAMLDAHAVEAAMRRMRQSTPGVRRRPAPAWVRSAAAAALILFAVSGAAAVVGRRMWAQRQERSPEASSQNPSAPDAAKRAQHRSGARSAPVVPAETVQPSTGTTLPAEAPPATDAPPTRARAAVSAAGLLERGQVLRRQGHTADAIAVYRRLQRAYPDSAEARLSFALAGHLLLEAGRPRDALTQFERHLQLGGAVGEEALAGRANALERLGRTDDAITAWKRLLALHPSSVYAERARARLDQLERR